MSVRVRYAPSPTGMQHIGGIRTALFNYFFAKANKGSFILRVEDTDRTRFNPEALEDLFSSLEWLNIHYDEGPGKDGACGPYVQSERKLIYAELTGSLLNSGNAYHCFCSTERLDLIRDEQKLAKKNIGYDRHCRNISIDEAKSRINLGEKYVIRLKMPTEGRTVFNDFLLGEINKKNRDISPDPVIMKSDGFPTYHLANVIDDHEMGITHVLRAQEWIPSGPLHINIYRAFGWTPPIYCHLPMVMSKDGQKLSKRHGSMALRDFRKAGYLSKALINFISLLGWSYDDSRELFTMDELCELFSLEKINKSPAVFDYRKLDWFNGYYIRSMSSDFLKSQLIPVLVADGLVQNPPTANQLNIIDGFMPIVTERLKRLNDITSLIRFLFLDPGCVSAEEAVPKGMDVHGALDVLTSAVDLLSSAPKPPGIGVTCTKWDEAIEHEFRDMAASRNWKIGVVFGLLRIALTASSISPPLIPVIRLLGLSESLRRIRRLILTLEDVRDG
ncbi:Glutamyl-tRNA synthetase @ Glutamyl-tRNA(Gln) synthetase [Olavius algarvensis spirochete endosymbiont]|uniref:glutamate--tRNA ligase n=1 Tax=Olavius algarvensis spirochete endosymbiont TaxID=260710 RepID=UPI00052DC9BC|nr:glutamate--tRNA ligase [Olavius algarvensis spirochete endosymbiont]KGM43052.1 glutamyl-tRNA synthetase [Alkalispirochaeta odontotermitis]VDB01247.1 Glutamyl-tRNA synthetase @ Glutamyl-tRNA(Gln) synthetase [Olavius algarvensis spirochete endosymbiont]